MSQLIKSLKSRPNFVRRRHRQIMSPPAWRFSERLIQLIALIKLAVWQKQPPVDGGRGKHWRRALGSSGPPNR